MKVDFRVFTLHTECVISVVRAAFLTCEPWGWHWNAKAEQTRWCAKTNNFQHYWGTTLLEFSNYFRAPVPSNWRARLFPVMRGSSFSPLSLSSGKLWTAFEMAGSDTSLPSNLAEPHWRAPGMFFLLMNVLWHTTAPDGRCVQFTRQLPTKLEQRKEKNQRGAISVTSAKQFYLLIGQYLGDDWHFKCHPRRS